MTGFLMNRKIFLIELFISSLVLYKFRILEGLLFLLILWIIFIKSLEMIYKLEKVNYFDLLYCRFNLEGASINHFSILVENTSQSKLKSILIERILKRIYRLQQLIVFKFNLFFWKTVSFDEVLKRVEINEEIELLDDSNDLLKIINQEQTKPFDFKELHWKITIYKVKNTNNSILLMKFDHIIFDGMSSSLLASLLTDNYSENVPTYNFPGILSQFLGALYFPYYLIKLLMRVFKSSNFPNFLKENKNRKNETFLSKKFDFITLKKICSKLNCSFNDINIYVIASSLRKLMRNETPELEKKIQEVFMGFPQNTRNINDKLEDASVSNGVVPSFYFVPLFDNFYQGINYIRNNIGKKHRNPIERVFHTIFLCLSLHLPYSIKNFIIGKIYGKLDVTFSNIIGPKKQIFIHGEKGYFKFFVPTNSFPLMLLLFSNNDYFQFSITPGIGFNYGKELTLIINNEVEEIMKLSIE